MAGGGTDWKGYYDVLAGRPARPLLHEALRLVGEQGEGKTAVDLGFGDGTETRLLLSLGWRVHAVDAEPAAAEHLLAAVSGADVDRLMVVTADFADVPLPRAHLVFGGLSIPFCRPAAFPHLWQTMIDALVVGGLLACHLFGDRDTWVGERPDMTFLDEPAVRALLDGLDVVAFREREFDGRAYSGPKHWHVFEVLARRPGV